MRLENFREISYLLIRAGPGSLATSKMELLTIILKLTTSNCKLLFAASRGT